jgi:hypothetical protein
MVLGIIEHLWSIGELIGAAVATQPQYPRTRPRPIGGGGFGNQGWCPLGFVRFWRNLPLDGGQPRQIYPVTMRCARDRASP